MVCAQAGGELFSCTFVCLGYVKDTWPNLRKLDDYSPSMVFISYEEGSKAYCMLIEARAHLLRHCLKRGCRLGLGGSQLPRAESALATSMWTGW